MPLLLYSLAFIGFFSWLKNFCWSACLVRSDLSWVLIILITWISRCYYFLCEFIFFLFPVSAFFCWVQHSYNMWVLMCNFEMILIMICTIFVASQFYPWLLRPMSFGRRQKLDKPSKTGMSFNTCEITVKDHGFYFYIKKTYFVKVGVYWRLLFYFSFWDRESVIVHF